MPTTTALRIALLRSAVAREMIEETMCCSTPCRLLAGNIIAELASAMVGSVPLELPAGASKIACCSSACAWSCDSPDSADWYCCRWAAVAEMLNSARLLACCASAVVMAATLSAPKLPLPTRSGASAEVRMAPCSDTSSFILEMKPSTWTVSARLESLLPSAISLSRASTASIVFSYSWLTARAGRFVLAAAARSAGSPAIAVFASWASWRTSGG